MKTEKEMKPSKSCCCISGLCHRFSRKMDLPECYNRGGRLVDNCSECK